MPNALVATDRGIRWMNEAEQARLADAAELRALEQQFARADLEDARVRATQDRRRTLPRLTDATVRGLEEALLHRALPDRYAATPAARRWLDFCPLVEVAESWLTMAGDPDPRGRGRAGLAMALLSRGGPPTWTPVFRAHGFLATSDLPGLLDTVAQTIFLDAYGDTVRSFTPWTSAITVPDFKATVGQVVEFPTLLELPEHAEYVAGAPFGPAVPIRLTRFGRRVAFTREAVLRDDVASLGQLQQALGVAAASVENTAVYDLLVSNPTMSDGFALFSPEHANLLPAAALDTASLGTACAAVATNSNHGRPAYLLVGTKDGPTARELVTKQTPPDAGDASGVLQVVQDDRIPSGFYVTTDPGERPTVATAHLTGVDGPELLSRDAFDIDARQWKARLEFGAAVVDWRGMVFTPAM
jgi:hypothetical protein